MPVLRRPQHKAEAPQMAPGTLVGDKYVVDEVLGSGAMGFVVSATHKLIGQRVAIKFIKAAYIDSEDALARFKREARALVAVQSENVVRVFDYGTMPDESPYLVMEYLTGRDLQQELRARGRLPLQEAAEIILQACEGLASVHARGIVHRDIKPANLFLTQRANGKRLVKIVDFGIAKAQSNEEELTITKGSIGSPHYMSPEQLRNARGVDARSDVWSLGVTLYRALTGELPFSGESVATLLAAVISEQPRSLCEERPELPPEMETIVGKCLAKSADERYASAQELADALAPFAMPSERARGESPGSVEPSPTPPQTSGFLHESTSKAHVVVPSREGRWLPEWKPRLALAAAIGVPLVVVSLALRLAPGAGSAGAKRPLQPATSSATAITDLPLPKTANAAAAAAYMAALQAVRDASFVEATNGFDQAATLDPTMAAAQLRSAVYGDWLIGTETRRHARAALALRASLSDSDRELLEAVEPLYLAPHPEVEESKRRIDRLVASRPGDTELLFLSALLFLNGRPRAELRKITDRLLELDPRFAGAAWLRALASELELDRAAVESAVAQCLAIAPSAASCLRVRATLEDALGDCAGLEADAQRMVAMEDMSYRAHDFLAIALFARGAPIDAVRASLDRKWKATPERSRSWIVPADEARLALARGDFAAASKNAADLDRIAQAGGTEQERVAAALLTIDLDTEIGDVAGAAQVADAYLRRVGAWPEEESIDDDPRPRLYAAAVRGGLRTQAESERARREWRAQWDAQIQPLERGRVWLEGYAAPARTREEADAALAELPAYEPIPAMVLAGSTVSLMANVHALAGRQKEALSELRAVTSSCHALADPIAYEHAQLQLGQALEDTGDRAGSCAAYGAVLDRWGAAKRSLTAAAASARVKALGCRR